MRRALILSSLPTAGMAAWLYFRPQFIPDAPQLLALCAATSLGLAFIAHLIKRKGA